MQVRRLAQDAVLLALAVVMHAMIPGFGIGNMKMDFLLSMVFLCLYGAQSLQEAILVSLTGGILAAMTTSMAGGQIPNIVDKLVSGLLVYALLTKTRSIFSPVIAEMVLGGVGTIVSGAVFLAVCIAMGIMDASAFGIMMLEVVLPALVANVVLIGVLEPIRRRLDKTSLSPKPNKA